MDHLAALINFGYEKPKAAEALKKANNDLNKAIDILTENSNIRYGTKYFVAENGIYQQNQ